MSSLPVHPEAVLPKVERIDGSQAFIAAAERPRICAAHPRSWLRIRPSLHEEVKGWGLRLLSGLSTVRQVVTFEVVLLRNSRGPQTLLFLTTADEDDIKMEAALTMALAKSEVRRVKDPIWQFIEARKREQKGTYQVQFYEFVPSGELWDTLRSSRPDLVDDVCRCVHLLGDGELAFVQVLFGANRGHWAAHLEGFLALRDPILDEYGQDSGRVRHPIYTDQELKAAGLALRNKLRSHSQLAFSVLYRVGHVSPLGTNQATLEGLCTPLESLSHGRTALKKVSHTCYPKERRREMIFARAVFRHGTLVTAEELAQTVVLPSAAVLHDAELGADKVRSTAPVPRGHCEKDIVGAGDIRLGVNVHRGEKHPVIWADKRSNPHLAIIGRTGTGKTNFLRVLIRQILEQEGNGLAVFDPLGGNLSREALEFVPRSRWDQTLYIDAPSFPEHPIPFNYLDLGGVGEGEGLLKETIRNDLLSILEEQLEGQALGVQIKETLLSTVVLLMENPGSTIADIPRVLQDHGFRAELLDAPGVHEIVRQFWARFRDTDRISPVTNKMVEFLLSDIIRPIISQRRCGIDFQQAFRNGDVFIFNLAKSRVGGDRTVRLLGKLFLSRFTSAAFTRPPHAPDYYLLLDESQYLVTDSLKSLLSGGRQFRVHLVVVTQTTADLPTEFRQHLIMNASKVSFAVTDNKTDHQFLNSMAPWFTPQDIQMLGVGEAVCRFGEKPAFSLKVDLQEERPSGEAAKYIKKRSREVIACGDGRERDATEQGISAADRSERRREHLGFVPKFSHPASSTRESEQK